LAGILPLQVEIGAAYINDYLRKNQERQEIHNPIERARAING